MKKYIRLQEPLYFLTTKISNLFFLGYFLLLFLPGCNQKGGKDTGTTVATDTLPPPLGPIRLSMNTKLDTLILENYQGQGHAQLKQLLRDATVHEKLILQFYHNDDDKLTLAIWPSQRHNQDNDAGKMQVLHNWHTSTVDISGKKIFLGDQQISDPAFINFLTGIINMPDDSLIFFMPKIVNKHIIYDLGIDSPSDTAAFDKAVIRPLPTPIHTDPSPPAKAN